MTVFKLAVQAASESQSAMQLKNHMHRPHTIEPKPSGVGLERAFDAVRSQNWIGQYKHNE